MNYKEMCEYLFKNFAPSFNFEKTGEQLLALALDRGFVTRYFNGENAFYSINEDY